MRVFQLIRDRDVSGVSGTGVVAEGIEFSDGKVALRWIVKDHRSTVTWDDMESVEAVHGHEGATRIQWVETSVSTVGQTGGVTAGVVFVHNGKTFHIPDAP